MPKSNPRAELDKAGLGRRCRRFGANPELRGSSPHQCLIADRLGRGDQQQAPGLHGENVEPAAEALFDITGQSHRIKKSKSSDQLLRSKWTSPKTVKACTMRSSHARFAKEVRSGVPGGCGTHRP